MVVGETAGPAADRRWPWIAIIFLGGDFHVASSGFLYTLPEVRAHFRDEPGRYLIAPVVLVCSFSAAAVAFPGRWRHLFLFMQLWQWFHYQKQNVGMVALTGSAFGHRSMARAERWSVVGCGVFGIAALTAKLGWYSGVFTTGVSELVDIGLAGYLGCVALAVYNVARRPDRSWRWVAMYAVAIGFFAPVFLFDSVLAAATSIAIAHGFQYLVIMGGLAASEAHPRRPWQNLAIWLGIACALAFAVRPMWRHLDVTDSRSLALFGAYQGFLYWHFVLDAGIWRLRDPWNRRFMGAHLPYLLGSPTTPAGPR